MQRVPIVAKSTFRPDERKVITSDPYNDFMSEGGKFHERTKETAEAAGFYDNLVTTALGVLGMPGFTA